MTKAMKPEDFDSTFAPTYIRVANNLSTTGEIVKSKPYILLFDNHQGDPGHKHAVGHCQRKSG